MSKPLDFVRHNDLVAHYKDPMSPNDPLVKLCVRSSPEWRRCSGEWGGEIVVADEKAKLRSFTILEGKVFSGPAVQTPHHTVTSIKLAEDNRTLLTSGSEGHCALWNLGTGELIRDIEVGRDKELTGSAFLGNAIVTSGPEALIRLWSQTSGELLAEFSHTSSILQLASSEQVFVWACSDDRNVTAWRVAEGQTPADPDLHVAGSR